MSETNTDDLDEVKWKCLACEAENFTLLDVGNESGKQWSVTSLPLALAGKLHGTTQVCKDCNQAHNFLAPKTRMSLHYFVSDETPDGEPR